ncbi:MAG: hypothetical protein K0S32_363 [Bacteroidetes bacterium]|jgi:hypothetical protein|nr:hypothetical protein [Bacteroidota bacterium]
MKQLFTLVICSFFFGKTIAQVPTFGNEIPVTINGYTLDAMEPSLSPDGNAMFFNSLNDGNTTSLYYAAKVNDSTFNLVGLMPVVNQTVTPRLDAVASVDTAKNFFWVSTRNYPTNMYNFHRVKFLTSGYTNFGRVYGDIYVLSPGWLIMDAAINHVGDKLMYCNAWFNGCAFNMPCKSKLGFAQKTNDSTFTKYSNSASLLANVNDTNNYIIYAPELTGDELELYFTRAVPGVAQTEICVSVRSNTSAAFGAPSVLLPMSSTAPEGPTLSADKSKMYYHRNAGGTYKLFLRKKNGIATGIPENSNIRGFEVFPNPTSGIIRINSKETVSVYVYNSAGTFLFAGSEEINLSGYPTGLYLLRIADKDGFTTKRVILSPPTQ